MDACEAWNLFVSLSSTEVPESGACEVLIDSWMCHITVIPCTADSDKRCVCWTDNGFSKIREALRNVTTQGTLRMVRLGEVSFSHLLLPASSLVSPSPRLICMVFFGGQRELKHSTDRREMAKSWKAKSEINWQC